MPAIYITSLASGDGQTAVACSLAMAASASVKDVAYFKPVTVGGVDDKTPDLDVAFCNERLGSVGVTGSPEPLRLGTEALGGGLGVYAKGIQASWQAISSRELVIIDGLPSVGETASISSDLVTLFAASVVAIVRYRREGQLEQVLALRERFGDQLKGIIFNAVPALGSRHAREIAKELLEEAEIQCLGFIPEEPVLLGFTVAEYGERLGGRIINNGSQAGELIENLLVGAMALDPGELYYERKDNKALITRGDRPDLQWSALDTSTRCLILTQGIEPIPYVLNKAQEAGVPVVVVPKGTLETIDDIETFVTKPTFHNPRKLALFTEMLTASVDLARLRI